ncbi:MAG: hypothetical protein KGM49_15475, partial [Sphingomonadales bacterium]|nr:hypothetical protein [Sphingomonadales bacterium]
MTAIVRDTGGEGGQVDLPTSLHCAKAQLDHLELGCAALVCALMSVGLNYLLGRDLNWDYFNYHAYAAQLMVQDRLAQDFFAAGYQGYMNPLPFLPFALMNQAGWSALQIGSGLALIQSLDAFFVYLIAREFTSQSPAPRLSAAVVAFLGCATAIYASQLGSSFVDASTAVPVMAGLWLICRRQTVPNFCAAAALAGAAVALKLTNVPFAAATLLATAFCVEVRSTAGRAKALIQASAAMGIGFLLLYAWWGWKLQHLFGSPVFPLFNQIFRAPDFPAESMRLDRFVPQSLGALLSLPMRMAEQSSWIYTEVVAPDIRPAVLILLLLGVVLLRLRRSLPVFGALAPEPRLRVVGTYFLSALALWFATSANGRYALPLLFLLGPFCYVAATRLLGARVGLAACAIVVILQTAHAAIPGNPRWNPHPWSAEWLPASIPSVLRDKPALFVVVGLSSESYLAGYMNPQSSFINPIGLLSLRTNGPGWDRFEALRARYAGDTWVVFP